VVPCTLPLEACMVSLRGDLLGLLLGGGAYGDGSGHGWPTLLETRPAQHWAALGGLEGNGSFGGALRTDRPGLCPHAVAGSSYPLNLALFTTLWIVLELLIVKEQLFAGGKDEIVTAIRTFQDLVDEIHTRPPQCALEYFNLPSTNRLAGIFSPICLIHLYSTDALSSSHKGKKGRENGSVPTYFHQLLKSAGRRLT
jgi:hypothetical protein